MEHLKMTLNDDPAYRELLGDQRIQEHGDMELATIQQKDGMVCICIAFTVRVHPQPGSSAEPFDLKVSAVTSGKLLKLAAESIQAAHPVGNF